MSPANTCLRPKPVKASSHTCASAQASQRSVVLKFMVVVLVTSLAEVRMCSDAEPHDRLSTRRLQQDLPFYNAVFDMIWHVIFDVLWTDFYFCRHVVFFWFDMMRIATT